MVEKNTPCKRKKKQYENMTAAMLCAQSAPGFLRDVARTPLVTGLRLLAQ